MAALVTSEAPKGRAEAEGIVVSSGVRQSLMHQEMRNHQRSNTEERRLRLVQDEAGETGED